MEHSAHRPIKLYQEGTNTETSTNIWKLDTKTEVKTERDETKKNRRGIPKGN